MVFRISINSIYSIIFASLVYWLLLKSNLNGVKTTDIVPKYNGDTPASNGMVQVRHISGHQTIAIVWQYNALPHGRAQISNFSKHCHFLFYKVSNKSENLITTSILVTAVERTIQ